METDLLTLARLVLLADLVVLLARQVAATHKQKTLLVRRQERIDQRAAVGTGPDDEQIVAGRGRHGDLHGAGR